MKTLFILCSLILFQALSAQQFNLLGERYVDTNWDFPLPEGINQGPDGSYYVYLDLPELMKLDSNEEWEDLSMGSFDEFNIITEGVVMEDGTVYAGFSNNSAAGYEAHILHTDGSSTQLGDGNLIMVLLQESKWK